MELIDSELSRGIGLKEVGHDFPANEESDDAESDEPVEDDSDEAVGFGGIKQVLCL